MNPPHVFRSAMADSVGKRVGAGQQQSFATCHALPDGSCRQRAGRYRNPL